MQDDEAEAVLRCAAAPIWGPAAVAGAGAEAQHEGEGGTATHTCHAVVLWLEYDLSEPKPREAAAGAEGADGRLAGCGLSTGPGGWPAAGGPGPAVQGVYLLPQPLQVSRGSALRVRASFDGLDADVAIEVEGQG